MANCLKCKNRKQLNSGNETNMQGIPSWQVIFLIALGILTVIVLCFFFSAVTGHTFFINGTSMLPNYRSGMIAFCYPQSEYKVGDVVLYNNTFTVYDKVFHRIINITDGLFIFKGDNNEREDIGFHNLDSIKCKIIYAI